MESHEEQCEGFPAVIVPDNNVMLDVPMEHQQQFVATDMHVHNEDRESLPNEANVTWIDKMEVKNDLTIVNDVIQKTCEPCLYDEMEAIAVAFCVKCAEFLCAHCTRDHRRNKFTRQHKLLNDENMPNSSTVFKSIKELTSCTEHPDMEASYECKEHNAFICTTCVAVTHRKCDNVTEVSKSMNTDKTSCTEPLLEEQVRLILEKTVTVIISKEENMSALLSDQTQINTKRNKFKDKISLHIQNLCEISESETEVLLRKKMAEIESDVQLCKALEIEEKKKQELLETTLLHGNPVEIRIISKKILSDLQRFGKETEFQNAKAKVRLDFAENARILDQSPLCYISATKEQVESDSNVAESQMEHSSDICVEDFNAKIKDKSEVRIGNDIIRGHMEREIGRRVIKFDTELQTDFFKCTINSILILNDGRIVIIDQANASLKVLDADYSVQLTHTFRHKPVDICEVSTNEVVVVFDNLKRVMKYEILDKNIMDNGGFPTRLYALSIATFNSQESTVAIFFSNKQLGAENSRNNIFEVQVRNIRSCHIICTLSVFNAKYSMQMTISNPSRICVFGKEKKRMLITIKDKLHIFETVGSTQQEGWVYKMYESISDVTVDGDENVYIVCPESHNIHQISATNFSTNRVLTSKLSRPVSLCIDKEGTQILVGCKQDGYLHVYQFV